MNSQPSQYDLTSQDADRWAWMGTGPKPDLQWVSFEGETAKARPRREQEGWFEKYAPPELCGVDIGCGPDPLNHSFRRWDKQLYGEGDGTVLADIPAGVFHTVYCSHVLEHLDEPRKAIARWYEVLAPGGHLIILVPHRDLFEQKRELPSLLNPWHKHFWLPDQEELPCTKSLKKEVLAAIPDADIVSLRVLDAGYEPGDKFCFHPSGEYSVEIIVKKPESAASLTFGPVVVFPGETHKAHARRLREGFFEKYCPIDMSGIDIGCGLCPVSPTFRRWDASLGEGDGTYLEGIPPNTFQTVHTSHLLEHLQYPRLAIARWYEVLRPGGHLIIMVPHRDLFEEKKDLPSSKNFDHKHFWLPEEEDFPWTKSLKGEVLQAIPNANIVSLRTLDTDGEYSIEIIVGKP